MIAAATALLILGGVALGQSDETRDAYTAREIPGEFQFVRLAYAANRFAGVGNRLS